MKIIEEKLNNGNTVRYQQLENGTCYNAETPADMVKVLESARLSRDRIRVFYGDQVTGRCWMEENDTIGTIGRSTGRIKIPLLIKTRRSCGGGALLDSAIVKIMLITTKFREFSCLYEHPNFNMPEMKVVDSHVPGFTAGVDFDNSRQANFQTREQAERYIAFMKGERGCK